MIDRLVRLLHLLDTQIDADDVRDVLWLAGQLAAVSHTAPSSNTNDVMGHDGAGPLGGPQRPDRDSGNNTPLVFHNALPETTIDTVHPPVSTASLPDVTGGLYQPGAGDGGRGVPFRVPTAAALGESLDVAHALRPLMRRVSSRVVMGHDEEATIRRIAEEGVWLPVMRPARSRWFDIVIVADEHTSMRLWDQAIQELQRLLERHGAFRDVRLWRLRHDATGDVQLFAGNNPSPQPATALHNQNQHRLILLVSDARGRGWASGVMTHMLSEWSQLHPVALVQPLPQRLWRRTALQDVELVRLRANRPGAPNHMYQPQPLYEVYEEDAFTGLRLPVLTLEPESFGRWAQIVAGQPDAVVGGVILPNGPLDIPSPPATVEEMIAQFQTAISPTARQLARLLSYTAPLTLPVMRLVQATMLPQSRQVHLAEVLLSGVLRLMDGQDRVSPQRLLYEFDPTFNDLLRNSLPAAEAQGVLAAIAAFIEREIGHPLDFDALLGLHGGLADEFVQAVGLPFTRVSVAFLSRFSATYGSQARQLGASLAQARPAVVEAKDDDVQGVVVGVSLGVNVIATRMNPSIAVLSADVALAEARAALASMLQEWVVLQRNDLRPPGYHLYQTAELVQQLAAMRYPTTTDPLLKVLQLVFAPRTPRISILAELVDVKALAVVIDVDGTPVGVIGAGLRNVPFRAYPRLDAPERARPQETVPIQVGFRTDSDATLTMGRQAFVFDSVKPGDTCAVLLQGDGITLNEDVIVLPLTHDAVHSLAGMITVANGAARLRADYYFRNVLIGQAECFITVTTTLQAATDSSLPLAPPDPTAEVDLLLIARRLQSGGLVWSVRTNEADLPAISNCYAHDTWNAPAAQRLAMEVMTEAEKTGGPDAISTDVLIGIGRDIAEGIPSIVWEYYTTLVARRTGPVTVLLKTNEPYIPWELAVPSIHWEEPPPAVAPADLTPGDEPVLPVVRQLPFWAAHCAFGRWVDRPDVVSYPPLRQSIAHMSAVAAPYGGIEDGELKYALEEQHMLVERWQAQPIAATYKDLEPTLREAPRPNHLLHVAAHGKSLPIDGNHGLTLADKHRLSPRQLMVSPGPGSPPRFALVVLNACRVGVPGTDVFGLAGFAVEVIKRGATGFLAPLWNVDDYQAYLFATRFYEQVLDDQVPVGITLWNQRQAQDRFRSTTPFAYVWYGHPLLRLDHQRGAVQ